jgi:O-antigen/teichoic acid export membrane protein
MHITKSDVLWNYGATFLKIASSILLFPIILRMMPSETVAIWTIFITITAFANLLDFGFSSSFTRNITYVFSGVKSLKSSGFETIGKEIVQVDYGLLKGVISSMKWFYGRVAVILFFFLITLGTYYIYTILHNYKGQKDEVYISWIILCILSTYNLYTLYYDSLLQGKGLVKRSKQILIAGQTVYLIIATVLIILGNGLIAIISAQASSIIIVRYLSYQAFFTKEIKQKLLIAMTRSKKEILNAISPNAVKIGLTSLGSFMVQRSAIVIGSLYLPLIDIASYGITMQLIGVIAGLAGIYTATHQPKIAQLRVLNKKDEIKEIYIIGQYVSFLTFLIGGIGLIFIGVWCLNIIGSKTLLIPNMMILVLLVIQLLENNHAVAGGILLSKNEVPFFKASILSGTGTVILLYILFNITDLGIWSMIVAPGFAQAIYQNWKWPMVVIHELNISAKDFISIKLARHLW